PRSGSPSACPADSVGQLEAAARVLVFVLVLVFRRRGLVLGRLVLGRLVLRRLLLLLGSLAVHVLRLFVLGLLGLLLVFLLVAPGRVVLLLFLFDRIGNRFLELLGAEPLAPA